ncbi:MAG TPA: hypothetical protein VHS99_02975 [Chloroflexota bacterium]|nr:hypothetical protein [Chloroflexota bacterium]
MFKLALPARSLTYAPLLVAISRRRQASPPWDVVPLLLSGGRQVAAAVVSGVADAGAMPLGELLKAVASGAPLIGFGAVTRRFGGHLVAAPELDGDATSLLLGRWRAVPFGLQTGSEGSEAFLRLWWLSAGPAPDGVPQPGTGASAPGRDVSGEGLLAGDPLAGEPRWIGYGTAEGLVAALKDGRIKAFIGPAEAAAQAMILGGGRVVASFSGGSTAAEVSQALCTVLVARSDRLMGASPAGGAAEAGFRTLLGACAGAAAALATPEGRRLAAQAMPERDPLGLELALALDAPGAAQSVYAPDGRLPVQAVAYHLELLALAGVRWPIDPATVVTDRFSA